MSDDRGRGVAWAGFLLGLTASVAANVAHAQPTTGARLMAGFIPLALLVAVEVLTRVDWREGWGYALTRYGGVVVVALGAAVTSYRHMYELALSYGEGPAVAAIVPLVVDGLMVVCGMALLSISRNRHEREQAARAAETEAARPAAQAESARPELAAWGGTPIGTEGQGEPRNYGSIGSVSGTVAAVVPPMPREAERAGGMPLSTGAVVPAHGSDVVSDHVRMPDEDARRAARDRWRQGEAAGTPVSGAQLGREFGRSARWGRQQATAAQSEMEREQRAALHIVGVGER